MKKVSLILYICSALTFLLMSSFQAFAADEACIQVIQSAKNTATWECKDFPTPCDVPDWWEKVNTCANTDTQIIDKEQQPQNLNVNFSVKTFSSCEDMEDVFKKFIKEYGNANPNYREFWGPQMLEDSAAPLKWVTNGMGWDSAVTAPEIKAENFSQTNIQVTWVDESEIIKTDWKYIYYYNRDKHAIYIANAFPADKLEIVKVIKIPTTFTEPEIYLSWNNLTIIATKYQPWNWGYYWFNRSVKTVIINYDISNLNNLKVEKYLQVDWSVSKSRRIGKYVYVLSQSSFVFPYLDYYGPNLKSTAQAFDSQKLEVDFNPKKVLPKKAELRLTDNKSQQNVNLRWRNLPYNVSQTYSSKCSDIEYVIPDSNTLSKYSFVPSYLTLSVVNLDDPSQETKTKLFFWDVAEVHMSLDNLYITSWLYTPYRFNCPVIQCITTPCIQPDCAFPVFPSWQNTVIHKVNILAWDTKYQASTIIPGSPLNQYSMDQDSIWNFRIVTSSHFPDQYTNLFVLDKNLKTIWKLSELAKWENFQSSRFIWDKLYLVTFQQIDPLFVIDLKDYRNPKVLWELKIPGYSTYLHPYDGTHLIWIGYDTQLNQWGWTQNKWLKVDLYDISDFNNPKQQHTASFWDQGSYSDVLSNPRLFVWNAKEHILFMPATLFKNANDKANPYRNSDAFQWSVAIKIDKDAWIKELIRVTHIDTVWLEEKRKKDCAQYVNVTPPPCTKLINGEEYCPPVSTYVPEYCYATSPIGEYLASQIWQFSKNHISRNLFLDNIWYTVSNTKIQANDLSSNFWKIKEVEMK
ncbi:MAG: hypothetical protein ACD_3C00104G0002 [uncultured bacterium (gcode 4)]|uniref:Uncharacterized protein n=1 Tax=uncultured bacterium (gcode 4) TaxID=1234023 RepID=K2G1J3_9BACT|nr:MAG: hypothetical protein ACD_3C00104G0002 [uncultured bacterium (gcode 4)]